MCWTLSLCVIRYQVNEQSPCLLSVVVTPVSENDSESLLHACLCNCVSASPPRESRPTAWWGGGVPLSITPRGRPSSSTGVAHWYDGGLAALQTKGATGADTLAACVSSELFVQGCGSIVIS